MPVVMLMIVMMVMRVVVMMIMCIGGAQIGTRPHQHPQGHAR
jgi:hypothetical protein